MSETNETTQRWEQYFAAWGYLCCGRKDVAHAQSGLCESCCDRITSQLKTAVPQEEN
jgi:hypothetical protein